MLSAGAFLPRRWPRPPCCRCRRAHARRRGRGAGARCARAARAAPSPRARSRTRVGVVSIWSEHQMIRRTVGRLEPPGPHRRDGTAPAGDRAGPARTRRCIRPRAGVARSALFALALFAGARAAVAIYAAGTRWPRDAPSSPSSRSACCCCRSATRCRCTFRTRTAICRCRWWRSGFGLGALLDAATASRGAGRSCWVTLMSQRSACAACSTRASGRARRGCGATPRAPSPMRTTRS